MRPAHALSAALLALCALAPRAEAAEAADRLDRERLRAGVYVGAEVFNGLSQLRTGTANVDMTLTYLPAVAIGLDVWPSEELGVYLDARIGTGGTVTLPDGTGVDYNLHLFDAGGRYRWYFGPRSDAPAIELGLGLRGRYETATPQRPSVLVERAVVGPELGLALSWPVVSDRVWLRAGGHAGVPVFVREPDQDSGETDGGLMFGGGLTVAVRVTGGVYVQLDGEFHDETIDFTGPGNRAAGVLDARTHDRYITGGLKLRYAL